MRHSNLGMMPIVRHPDLEIFSERDIRCFRGEARIHWPILAFHRELARRGEFRVANELLETMMDTRLAPSMMIPGRLLLLAQDCGLTILNHGFAVIAWRRERP